MTAKTFDTTLSKVLFLAAFIFACMSTCIAIEPKEIIEWPRSRVESGLPESHPTAYYLYAARLFKEGDQTGALFWYYVGELRYRFYLAANPNLPPDGAPALFESLHESVGSVVADRTKVTEALSAKELQGAMDWDAVNENGATSKSVHRKEWLEIRGNLIELELGKGGH